MNIRTLAMTPVKHLHRNLILKSCGRGCLLLHFFSISAFADVHYVSLSGSHVVPFTTWATAATNIQAAVDAAAAGDTVLVTNGVYGTGGRTVNGALTNRVVIAKPLTLRSVNGPQTTMIQGAGPNGDSAIRCVYLGTNATLIGFTLTNGYLGTDYYWPGGGIFCEPSAILSNCVLTGNSAFYGGGVSDGTLYNCTLIGNSASNDGGGAFGSTLYNCIIYYNTALTGSNFLGCTLNYCCTTPHPGGTGNMTNEPMFVDRASGNLRLLSTSPCINAGTNQPWMIGTTDLDGHPRIINRIVDMGAHENDDSVIVDNADGPPWVEIVGSWTNSTSTPGYWPTNYIHDENTGKGTKSVTFRPNLKQTGSYEVSIWYTAGSSRATNVPVDIVYASGSKTVLVNQRVKGTNWVVLETNAFAAGTNGYVRIRTDGTTSGHVIADAVRFRSVGAPSTPVVILEASDPIAGEPGSGEGIGLFTFIRTGSTTGSLTVNFTVGGTATSGSDYYSIGTTVIFATGRVTAIKTVNVIDDSLMDPNETVVVTLAGGTGYTVGSNSTATVTIRDDDCDTVSPKVTILSLNDDILYTDDLTGGGTPSASDTCNGYVGPTGAFDNVLDLCAITGNTWLTYGEGPAHSAWLTYDFGPLTSNRIEQYRIYGIGDSYNPTTWTFEGSSNNVHWIPLDQHSNYGNWSWRTFDISNTNAYRFYRINISSGGCYGVGISEMEMMEGLPDGTYTADVTSPTGLVTASDTHHGYSATGAVDNILPKGIPGLSTNAWLSRSSPPWWLRYDFGAGSAKVIKRYRINDEWQDFLLNTWTFEGSNDGATWTVLDQRVNYTNWFVETFDFNNPDSYRYYRMNISTGGYMGVAIGEMEMMEVRDFVYVTNATTIALSGIASDNGEFSVGWSNLTSGASGPATGTTNWSIAVIPLVSGTNELRVTATDRCGNYGRDTVKVYNILPLVNLALASHGSTITGSNGARWKELIDGITTGYTTSNAKFGYTYWTNATNAPGSMTLDLKGLCTISSMRLLLWDLDSRYYRYKIEASTNKANWTTVVDRTAVSNQCQSWQTINFNPVFQAQYLRLTGTYNSTNQLFPVVEWEVYGVPDIVISTNAVTVPERGTASFRVKLSRDPIRPTTVTVSWESGDADISVQSGNVLVFDTNTWSDNQTVTLAAAEDADNLNSTAIIQCSAVGAISKDVTATEADTNTPPTLMILTSTNAVEVQEGGTTNFQVKLSRSPPSSTTVTVSRVSGDTNITVQIGASLVFNTNNWNIYQTVTLAAGEDLNITNSTAIIRCSAINIPSVDVTAMEKDNRVLPSAYRTNLNRYAAATVRYFTSAQANNTNTAFTHTFYGGGPFQVLDTNTGNWIEWPTWKLNRGYGSHVNMNDVTLRFLSLAAAYKMNWLNHIDAAERYARSWGAILTGLWTIRSIQTNNNIYQYCSNTFHQSYQTTTNRANEYNLDRTVQETVCNTNDNKQSSDNNALTFLNLLLLEGLANDMTVTTIEDRVAITNLCRQIRDDINLRRFCVTNRVVMNYTNGVSSTSYWDHVSGEGALILGAMLLQGQIGANPSYGIGTSEFYATAPSLVNHSVLWSNRCDGTTTYVGKASYSAALYAHGLRAIHGIPITDAEFTTNVNFFLKSVKPVTEAQIDYTDCCELKALGSYVYSQTLCGMDLWKRNGVVYFAGNENNWWPNPSNDLAFVTGPHAWFVPLQRWRYLEPSGMDIGDIFAWAGEYETNFFHETGDSEMQLGWEATVPFHPQDTRYAWHASDGSWKYTDWGRPYEALNAAYTVLSIFDAMNPDKPLSAYNIEALRWGYIVQYLDSSVPLPPVLFPR